MPNVLRMKRIELDITQSQLSIKSGVEQFRISLFERGLAIPNPDQLDRLSKVLGTSPEELLKPAKGVALEETKPK